MSKYFKITEKTEKTVQLIAIIAVLFMTMVIMDHERFLRPVNIHNMLMQLAELGVYSLCIGIVYLAKGIDISIVSIGNLAGIVSGLMFRSAITPYTTQGEIAGFIALAVVISLTIGLVCGLINGILIAGLGIFPILVTLGTQSLFMGIGLILTQGRAVTDFPRMLTDIGNISLFAVGDFRGLPLVTAIFITLFIIMSIVVHKTPFGLKLQWYGANQKVSFFSGISNTRVVIRTYALSGLLASVAGLITMARTSSAMATYGETLIFQALMVCVLAGLSPIGGKGKYYNIIFAMIALQILSTGFNMMRISPLIRESIFGIMLIAAIVLEIMQTNTKAARLNRAAIAAERETDSTAVKPPGD